MFRLVTRGRAAAPIGLGSTALAFATALLPARAQDAAPMVLPSVTVAAPAGAQRPTVTIAPEVQRFALPQTAASIDSQQIEETTNAVDAEDAIKYFPSLFVRKRNNGDTQPTIATRTWGVNSSAHSLVYVDDIPISALISNNNTTGAPRWGLVSPEEISGMDFLYGPFAAEYPGNSMGGVLLITTRTPHSFEATATQTEAVQSFDMYKTRGSYVTSNTAATIGGKYGKTSWFLSFNHQEGDSQPLYFVTAGSAPAGTSGTIPAVNKTGAVADLVGAGGLLHSATNNLTAKVAVDLTDWLRASYTVGYWDNDTTSTVQSYLTDAHGIPTFGGVSGFANDEYTLQEKHLMNAVSLKTDTQGDWDWEAVLTRYDYLQDIQRNPAGVLGGTSFRTNGLITRMDGTGWSTQDLKAIWRPDGGHEVSFGLHRDQYTLDNPTYNTADWRNSGPAGDGTLSTDGHGKTETYALWAQDAWTFLPGLKLTVGARLENWRAFDGFNLSGAVAAVQPGQHSTNISPKASLSWQIDRDWNATLSYGQAYRYPTVSELYQIVSTGGTFAVPNPDLRPEDVHSWELALRRQTAHTNMRLSVFEEDTFDALVQQTNFINNVATNVWDNVSHTRDTGVELVLGAKNLLIPGLELSNSLTYVNSDIVSDNNFFSKTTTATGKRVPYVPDWRDTVQATYHPTDQLAVSLAARYSGRMFTTLDNTDRVSHVFGAFDGFFVVDTHIHYQINDTITADAGIDNLFNEKYFLYHPFPGRTYVASLKARF